MISYTYSPLEKVVYVDSTGEKIAEYNINNKILNARLIEDRINSLLDKKDKLFLKQLRIKQQNKYIDKPTFLWFTTSELNPEYTKFIEDNKDKIDRIRNKIEADQEVKEFANIYFYDL